MVIAKVTRIGSCRRWSSKAPMSCVVNTLVMATSRPFSGRPSRAALLGPRSTLANMVEFLRSLVTTILVPLLTLSVMFRRAMMGAPILRLRMCAGRHPSLMLVRYSWGYWWPYGCACCGGALGAGCPLLPWGLYQVQMRQVQITSHLYSHVKMTVLSKINLESKETSTNHFPSIAMLR